VTSGGDRAYFFFRAQQRREAGKPLQGIPTMTLKLIEDLALIHLPRHRSMLVSRARMRVLQSLPAPLRRALYPGTHR
jgi:hypothetical protein